MKTPLQPLRLVILVAVGLLVSLTSGNAQSSDTLVLTEADDGTTANAVVGQAITVNLHGNPTTGFAWVLASSNGDSVLTNGPATYFVDPGGGVGVGGTFSFPFLASKPGDTALSFDYSQWWEEGTPIQSFAVTIHVVPPRLSIQQGGTNVVISWPIAGSTNFFLEGAPSLEASQWAALNVLPLPEGTNYTVTLGTGGNALYFRLHHL
jgi:predicted secreted protein